MRMNISVPDVLAEEVRRRDIPISAVCQRALNEEVARLRAAEGADDITVITGVGDFADPANWAPVDGSKPVLAYRRHPEHGPGWVLTYELGEEPGDKPDEHFIAGTKADVDVALRSAREWLRLAARGDMEKITVEVGEPSLTVGFRGRWLVYPDRDETRSTEEGQDAGAYWGLALTGRGRIAVYTAHCNERWPASLDDYDSLDAAADNGTPADIIARAAAELGETRVLWRDI